MLIMVTKVLQCKVGSSYVNCFNVLFVVNYLYFVCIL